MCPLILSLYESLEALKFAVRYCSVGLIIINNLSFEVISVDQILPGAGWLWDAKYLTKYLK